MVRDDGAGEVRRSEIYGPCDPQIKKWPHIDPESTLDNKIWYSIWQSSSSSYVFFGVVVVVGGWLLVPIDLVAYMGPAVGLQLRQHDYRNDPLIMMDNTKAKPWN